MSADEFSEIDAVVSGALNGQPGANELRGMRQALEKRMEGLVKLQKEGGDEQEKKRLAHEIAEITKQVNALAEEEVVAQFVEDSVRFAWNVHRLDRKS